MIRFTVLDQPQGILTASTERGNFQLFPYSRGSQSALIDKMTIYDIRVEVPVAASRLTDLHQDGITIEQMTEKTTVVRIARLDRYAAALIQ